MKKKKVNNKLITRLDSSGLVCVHLWRMSVKMLTKDDVQVAIIVNWPPNIQAAEGSKTQNRTFRFERQ